MPPEDTRFTEHKFKRMSDIDHIKQTLTLPEALLIQETRKVRIEFGQALLVVHYENGKMTRVQAAHDNLVENWLLRVK